ncbi:MAG: tetratricopeptide repeat protein [Bdellovibrio sp.]|jgi:Ca-activated chloride channel family protein
MKILFALSLFLLTTMPAQGAGHLRALWLNRQGVELLKAQKPQEAIAKFSEALVADAQAAEVHLNMGLAFEALGDAERAMMAYRTADRFAGNFETQFVSRFNQGALMQKAKKTDEALEAYHKALEVNPESKETKINIELLIQDQQQQQQKGGQGQQNQPKPQDDKGDNKDQQQDPQDDQGDQKEEKPKEYSKNKPQPKPFKSEELTQGDVNKILGELRNQEQRIRSEYNKREVKEKSRDKDW